MQAPDLFGSAYQSISWVPAFQPPGSVFGYCVQPCWPCHYFNSPVYREYFVPLAAYRAVPSGFPQCDQAPSGALVPELPVHQQSVQQVEVAAEEEDVDILTCPAELNFDSGPLDNPLEGEIRRLSRQIKDPLPGRRLPGSTTRGKASDRACKYVLQQESERTGDVEKARNMAKLADRKASKNEQKRLVREAATGSLESLKDSLAAACTKAVHRHYRSVRRVEMESTGDDDKAKEAERLACIAIRHHLNQICGTVAPEKAGTITFTDAEMLNETYTIAYRSERSRELSRSGNQQMAKTSGRSAGHKAREQLKKELQTNPEQARKDFNYTPGMVGGKKYRLAYVNAKYRAYKEEMARSHDQQKALLVAREVAKRAGREARREYMLKYRLETSYRLEHNKSSASTGRENMAKCAGK